MSTDKEYLVRRRAFAEETGPRELWPVVDHWPLYCGVRTLARVLAVTELFRETLNVPGHLAEFGCYRGANAMLLAKLLRIEDPFGGKQVYAFDSFEGLTTFTAQDGSATDLRGQYRGSQEEFRAMIDLYDFEDRLIIQKGLIQDTLTPLLKTQPELRFSFVYCDTDLYEPTALILEHVAPRLMPGGLLVFDEWNMAEYPGEGRAVNEWLETHAASYSVEHVRGTRQPTLVLRKHR